MLYRKRAKKDNCMDRYRAGTGIESQKGIWNPKRVACKLKEGRNDSQKRITSSQHIHKEIYPLDDS
jgi:hypothetical protein